MEILRHADRRLRQVPNDDVHEMCAVVRRAVTAMAPVDAFFVGLYSGDRVLFIPYVHADGRDRGADTSRYGQHGLSAWVRASARPYRFADDNGQMIHKGAPMGDSRPSADAIAVPMFDLDNGQVVGMLNAQSYAAGSFDDVFVTGMEWLAKALVVALGGRSLDAQRADLYGDFPELDTGRPLSVVDLLDAASDRFDDVADLVDDLHERLDDRPIDGTQAMPLTDLVARLDDIQIECRRAAAQLTMMAVRATDQGQRERPGATLTGRELEIAELIATESLSNGELARRLTISEKTVKTHVSNILTKLGIRQRSELAWLLRADRHAAGS